MLTSSRARLPPYRTVTSTTSSRATGTRCQLGKGEGAVERGQVLGREGTGDSHPLDREGCRGRNLVIGEQGDRRSGHDDDHADEYVGPIPIHMNDSQEPDGDERGQGRGGERRAGQDRLPTIP